MYIAEELVIDSEALYRAAGPHSHHLDSSQESPCDPGNRINCVCNLGDLSDSPLTQAGGMPARPGVRGEMQLRSSSLYAIEIIDCLGGEC